MIAAFALPRYVGALPIFFSGVNSPLVMRRKTPAFGSTALPCRLPARPERRDRALSVVPRRSASWSSVTLRVGRRRGRPSDGLCRDEEIGAGFGPAVE